MTATTLRPPEARFVIRSHQRDGPLIRFAIVIAALLHVGALLLPLARSPLPVRPVDDGPIISNPYLPPPPLPERPERPPTEFDYQVPVPLPEPVDFEPVDEPRDEVVIDESDAPRSDSTIIDTAPPPTVAPSIVDEGHAGLLAPVPIEPREALSYPEVCRRIRLEGRVVLETVVDEQGRVADVEVLRDVRPACGMADEAVRAVSLWRYEPGMLDGRAVAVRMRVIVDFSLN